MKVKYKCISVNISKHVFLLFNTTGIGNISRRETGVSQVCVVLSGVRTISHVRHFY